MLERDQWRRVECGSANTVPLIPVWEANSIKLLHTGTGRILESPTFSISGNIPTASTFRPQLGIQHDGAANRSYYLSTYDPQYQLFDRINIEWVEVEISTDRIALAGNSADESIAATVEPPDGDLTVTPSTWTCFVYNNRFHVWAYANDFAWYWERGSTNDDEPAGTFNMSHIPHGLVHRSVDRIYDVNPPIGIYEITSPTHTPIITGIGSHWTEVQVAHDPTDDSIWAVVHDDHQMRHYSRDGELIDTIPIETLSGNANRGTSFVHRQDREGTVSVHVKRRGTQLFPEQVITTDTGEAVVPSLLEHDMVMLNPDDRFFERSDWTFFEKGTEYTLHSVQRESLNLWGSTWTSRSEA